MIIARTDALSASFIDTDIDPLDHPYILGQVDSGKPEITMTFPEAGLKAIEKSFSGSQRQEVSSKWSSKCTDLSLNEARDFA